MRDLLSCCMGTEVPGGLDGFIVRYFPFVGVHVLVFRVAALSLLFTLFGRLSFVLIRELGYVDVRIYLRCTAFLHTYDVARVSHANLEARADLDALAREGLEGEGKYEVRVCRA